MSETGKISVVICSCGDTLLEKIDIGSLVSLAEKCPDVVFVRASRLLCRSEYERKEIAEALRKEGAARIVFAGCSPSVGENFLGDVAGDAKIHPEMVVVCNLREQCAWITPGKAQASERSQRLLRRAIDRIRLYSIAEDKEFPVRNEVLIIGGGITGIQAALELSRLKHSVLLIEKEKNLGGSLLSQKTSREHDGGLLQLIGKKIEAINADENIQVMTSAAISRSRGYAGDFEVDVKRNGENIILHPGAIVIATGAGRAPIEEDYRIQAREDILTESELGELLFSEEKARRAFRPGTVVFFVLGMIGEHAKLNTIAALEQALVLSRDFGCRVFVGAESVQVAGRGLEALYREVRESGVIIFKYEEGLPEISIDPSGIRVKIRDDLLAGGPVSEVLTIPVNFLVLEQKFRPAEGASDVERILRLDTDTHGFFQADNVLRMPSALNRRGIFVAGSARMPQTIEECISDAGGAALAVHQLLRKGHMISVEGKNAVDKSRCTLCLTCYRLCPHQAVSWTRAAEISDAACEACGICSSDCPAIAIQLRKHTNEQILADLERALGDSV